MKSKLNSHLVILFLIFIPIANCYSQTSAKLISQNVTKNLGNNFYKVTKFKAIDLSNKSKSKNKTEALAKQLETKVTNRNDVQFDCSNPEYTKPLLLKQLNDIDTRNFEVTKNRDVKLDLWKITGIKLNKKDKLIQQNFWVFKDYPCTDKTSTRAIIGMTVYIYISNSAIGFDKFVVKNVDLGALYEKSNATFNIRFMGVTNLIDFATMPSSGELTAKDYSKVLEAFDKIKKALKSDTIVDPVIQQNILNSGDTK